MGIGVRGRLQREEWAKGKARLAMGILSILLALHGNRKIPARDSEVTVSSQGRD